MERYHNSTGKTSHLPPGRSDGRTQPLRPPVDPTAGASLGIPGKSCNPPLDEQIRKVLRWALQAASREILDTKAIRTCCRAVIPMRDGVDIWKSKENFHYGGLITCGSVWVCPVCGTKISERKRVELTGALATIPDRGWCAQLWTFTAPHNASQSLEYLYAVMNQARRKMLNRKNYKRITAALGVLGTIRGLEVTHSWENGFHVHFHVLVILSKMYGKDCLRPIENMLHNLWQKACVDTGLDAPSRAHGVSVEDGRKAAAYVGKWGLEHELTKSHSKQGREGHLTPFDFLREYLNGDLRYAPLFREYARVFKGKRQLVWSDGLRDLLNLGKEETDEEIAAREDETAAKFASIPLNVWRVILQKEKRGEVLNVCRQGHDALYDYMTDMMIEAGAIGDT